LRRSKKRPVSQHPFTVRRFELSPPSDNPTYLKQHERLVNGMRKAGVPEE
jgi:hypothetical protein